MMAWQVVLLPALVASATTWDPGFGSSINRESTAEGRSALHEGRHDVLWQPEFRPGDVASLYSVPGIPTFVSSSSKSGTSSSQRPQSGTSSSQRPKRGTSSSQRPESGPSSSTRPQIGTSSSQSGSSFSHRPQRGTSSSQRPQKGTSSSQSGTSYSQPQPNSGFPSLAPSFHVPPSSSKLPLNSPSNSSEEDFSMEEKCSLQQLESSSRKQKGYVNNYLTHTYDASRNNITIGFLSSFRFNKVFFTKSSVLPLQLALGALPIAVEAVNSDPTLLPGKQLLFEVADVGASNVEALAALSIRRMTAMRDAGHLAFIGPDENCANEALVAAAWNLPMITYKCADQRVSNKTKYYTVARTMPPSTKIVKALISLMKTYRWKKFVLLTEHTRNYFQIQEAVKSFADHHKMNITKEYSVHYEYTSTDYHILRDIVQGSLHYTRIYVLVASFEIQWDFVLALREAVPHQMAEYAIVTIDDDKYHGANESQEMRGVPGNKIVTTVSLAERLYHGFRAVVKITPTYPNNPKYREFEKKVLSNIKQHPFCVPYNPMLFRYIEVPTFAAHLYDAVMIYAQALNETLADPTADPANGTHIISLIKNRAFHSIQGFKVHMDENGDAEGSYSLLAIRKLGPGYSQPVGWHRVGEFVFHDKVNGTHDMDNLPTLVLNDTIPWLGGSPPRDEPPCGFASEKCDYDWHSMAVGMVVSMAFVVAALFLLRHYRYEHKLACLLWKIDMRDVKVINTEEITSSTHTNSSTVQVYRQSLFAGSSSTSSSSSGGVGVGVEGPSEAPRVAYCRMGLYRGNVVAIKPIKKRSVDLTRSIRKELKQMRDVRHENLLPFIGASVDTGNICVLTAYCTRGSLENVLMNDDLLLDDMFVASLVADLIKGMSYLHDSEVMSHGNLRSSNCLIDSRWVLQVADFGLHEFKASPDQVVEVRKKLWRAPELLVSSGVHPRGTQKGDVYSFGVILYEVVGRHGPWGTLMDKLSIHEVVSQVAAGLDPPLRPPLDSLKAPEYVHRCLKECWAEDPDDRPDFKLVRVRLKEMQAGLKLNIVDNMLAMMEKYAYNLEGKVQERTKQLMDEKKKTEILLLRMLPKSVAESLKRGEQVSPESYDNVTIYFSDIVGFTHLSAQSTPLQMVDMLNELYTCFDAIIGDYDVYKVETIGDAYMVVSGLPICNGDQHAAEIASMALKLLSAVKKFTIRHRPGDTLKLRIGIHSGPCVAGVVGLTMPRYCLFGDTVNTASRMESTGEELRIHISQTHKLMLDKLGGYIVQERGLTYVKGKGKMMTYWLVGEQRPGTRGVPCPPANPLATPGGSPPPQTPLKPPGGSSPLFLPSIVLKAAGNSEDGNILCHMNSEDNPSSSADNPKSSADNPKSSVDNPRSSADNTSNSADNPSTSADNPSSSADNSSSSADNPRSRADNPSSSADNTSNSADNPRSNADDPRNSSDNPSSSDDNPRSSADNISNSADNPRSSADNHSSSADNPSNSAYIPNNSADNPSKRADNSSNSADNLSNSADNTSKRADNPNNRVDNPSNSADNPRSSADNPSNSINNPSSTAVKPSNSADNSPNTRVKNTKNSALHPSNSANNSSNSANHSNNSANHPSNSANHPINSANHPSNNHSNNGANHPSNNHSNNSVNHPSNNHTINSANHPSKNTYNPTINHNTITNYNLTTSQPHSSPLLTTTHITALGCSSPTVSPACSCSSSQASHNPTRHNRTSSTPTNISYNPITSNKIVSTFSSNNYNLNSIGPASSPISKSPTDDRFSPTINRHPFSSPIFTYNSTSSPINSGYNTTGAHNLASSPSSSSYNPIWTHSPATNNNYNSISTHNPSSSTISSSYNPCYTRSLPSIPINGHSPITVHSPILSPINHNPTTHNPSPLSPSHHNTNITHSTSSPRITTTRHVRHHQSPTSPIRSTGFFTTTPQSANRNSSRCSNSSNNKTNRRDSSRTEINELELHGQNSSIAPDCNNSCDATNSNSSTANGNSSSSNINNSNSSSTIHHGQAGHSPPARHEMNDFTSSLGCREELAVKNVGREDVRQEESWRAQQDLIHHHPGHGAQKGEPTASGEELPKHPRLDDALHSSQTSEVGDGGVWHSTVSPPAGDGGTLPSTSGPPAGGGGLWHSTISPPGGSGGAWPSTVGPPAGGGSREGGHGVPQESSSSLVQDLKSPAALRHPSRPSPGLPHRQEAAHNLV